MKYIERLRLENSLFHPLFSTIYLLTFFGGYPLSLLMAWGFDHSLPAWDEQAELFGTVAAGYLFYYISYTFCRRLWGKPAVQAVENRQNVANFSANLTACLLLFVGLASLVGFIALNEGLLLFKLEKYSQIFSPQVQGVALKRFFYFFLIGLVLFFLLKTTPRRWWGLLLFGSLFGAVSYLAVGGTRANLALAVLFFLLLGVYQGYLRWRWLALAAVLGVVAMFFLALARYGLDVRGKEAWFTFLYLSRDTFSPWENVARIFSSPIEFQGLMPIVRDFYVYIPQSLWAERPDIVWNTANYFTKTVLGNQSGLAMSPTLLGSFYIMGGVPMILGGMAVLGGILAGLDRLFAYGKAHSAVVQAFCFGQLFNVIVLVREGSDAFFSRFAFFSVIFFACWGVACLLTKGRKANG